MGNGARKSHLQRWQSYRRVYGKLKPRRADRKVASSSSRARARAREGERERVSGGLVTAGLVSIVIAEQRICRHVFYCTMKLDGELRSGSEAAGEGARNRDRNKTDARAKRVTQRVTDRCGAAATIQTPARNIHRAKSFVSDESGNCVWEQVTTLVTLAPLLLDAQRSSKNLHPLRSLIFHKSSSPSSIAMILPFFI